MTLGSHSADTDIETPLKTRSGKIMRRLLRDVAEGRELGETSTLVDSSVFEAIRTSK
jgi:acetyl-CoA synthetase